MPIKSIQILCILALLFGLGGCSSPNATQTPEAGSAAGTAAPALVLDEDTCEQTLPKVSLRAEARCGTLTVYENRAAGSGRQIELHVAVLPAVSRNPAPDPVFFIPGGPGEAASTSYQAVSPAFDKIIQKRDVVLVDQRGTGASHALKCNFTDEQEAQYEDDPDPAAMQALFKTCLAQLDADPRFYTTAIAMDDLDQVRQALGYEQINLYGASYGTRAALAYLRQHPEHVRSVILDGVVPMGWVLGADAPADAQRALDMLFARCAADPGCQQAFPDLPQEFQALLGQLEAAPVEVALDHPNSGEPTTVTLDRDTFANTVHQITYTPEVAALLPLLIHTAYEKQDFARFAALTLSNEGLLEDMLSPGMRLSVTCAEDQPFFKEQPASRGYLGDLAFETFDNLCAVWPRGEIPADYRQPVQSDKPVLLISGEADPVTPPENAEQAAQTLPNSLQVVVPQMGHINVIRGCLPRLANQFIEAGSVQGLDTQCAQEITPLPFFVNFSGPQP